MCSRRRGCSLTSTCCATSSTACGASRQARAACRLAQAVELLGIDPLLSRRPDTLSGGERQRVGIARALATSPKLLLMDEPLASLDLQRKREILPYLERLHAELDIPVLYVSHAPDEVARLADHLVLLDAGRVIASGPADELMTRLDLPLAHGDTAGSMIAARVTAFDLAYGLTQVEFAGGRLSLPYSGARIGQAVRVRIQARDVSLTLHHQAETSVLNILPATDHRPGRRRPCAGDGGPRHRRHAHAGAHHPQVGCTTATCRGGAGACAGQGRGDRRIAAPRPALRLPPAPCPESR